MSETPSWIIDELAHAGPEHLDQRLVAAYDRKQGLPDPAEDLAALRDHGLGRAGTLVDLGAGTGQLALAVAPYVRRVVAVDVSSAMLQVLGRRAADGGLANIELVQAGFISYRHAGVPADAVFTRNALHHLPDFWKAVALERIAGMIRPGGILRRIAQQRSQPENQAEQPQNQADFMGETFEASGSACGGGSSGVQGVK